MLTLVMTLFGISMSDKINYYNYHLPQARKEIVREAEPELPQIEVVVELPIKEKEIDPIACSCVLYASQFMKLPAGDAIDFEPNGRPEIGGAVLFDYGGGIGHISIITAFVDNGAMIKESNYKKCKYTERYIEFDDKNIKGFYSDEKMLY